MASDQESIIPTKTWQQITVAYIIFVIVIMAFLLNYGVKIKNDEFCNSQSLIGIRDQNTLQNTHLLNTSGSFLLQKFNWHENELTYVKTMSFCYDYNATANKTINLNIIDQEQNILAKDYINNETGTSCINLNTRNIENQDFIGLQCVDCGANNIVRLNKKVVGEDQEFLYNQTTTTTKLDDKTTYDLRYTTSCKKNFKKMVNKFYLVSGLLLAIVLLMTGVGYLKKVAFKGWNL